jgi:hypothetical protein
VCAGKQRKAKAKSERARKGEVNCMNTDVALPHVHECRWPKAKFPHFTCMRCENGDYSSDASLNSFNH